MSNPYESPQTQSKAEAEQRRLSPIVVLLGWVSAFTDVATEMIAPQLSNFISVTLGGGKMWAGLVEGIAEFVSAIFRLLSGMISDKSKYRRALLLTGYTLSGLARPLMGFVAFPIQAVLVRSCDRIGKGLRSAPRDAMITDVTPPAQRGRAFGFHRAMDHAGAAVGPLIGFAVLYFVPDGFRMLCFASLIPGLIVIYLLYTRLPRDSDMHIHSVAETSEALPESQNPLSSTTTTDQTTNNKLGWRAWGLFSAIMLFRLGEPKDMLLLTRITDLGWHPATLSLVWFVLHVLKSTFTFWGGRIADYFKPRWPISIGWLVHIAVIVGLGYTTAAYQAAALMIVYAFYFGLSEPAEKLLISQWVGRKRHGTAFGWYALIEGLTALLANWGFGKLWESYKGTTTPWLPFLIAGALSAAGLIWLQIVFFINKQKAQ